MLLKTDLQLVVLILFSIKKSFQNLKLICRNNDVAEKTIVFSLFNSASVDSIYGLKKRKILDAVAMADLKSYKNKYKKLLNSFVKMGLKHSWQSTIRANEEKRH